MNYSKKSKAQIKAEGNPNTLFKVENDLESLVLSPDVSDFQPPSFLTKIAKQWYKKNLPLLCQIGVIKQTDLTTYAFCASSYGDFVGFHTLLEEEKQKEEKDIPTIVRLQNQKLKAQKMYLDYSKELGLTSVSRSKVRTDDQTEGNQFAEFS